MLGYPLHPPNASPAFCVPAPANSYLAVDKAPPEDHDEPLYSSVHENIVGPLRPPKASASFCSPAPAREYLAVDKAPPTDQAPITGTTVGVGVGVTGTNEFQKPLLVNQTLASLADENVCGVPYSFETI